MGVWQRERHFFKAFSQSETVVLYLVRQQFAFVLQLYMVEDV